MSVEKYNSLFFKKLSSGRIIAHEGKQMEHYVEGLPEEYQANLRHHNTLAAAMDEAIRIYVDLATLGHPIVRNGEKRKWESVRLL